MASNNRPSFLLLTIFLISLLLLNAEAQQQTETRLRDARQCRLERLSASRPSRRIESEGGVTELWNENEDQFQCAGVAITRNIIQPSCLSLPNFAPSPRLVYIQQGRGVLGFSAPGCPETYQSSGQYRGSKGGQQQAGESDRDQHQKIHRLRQGDIVALPAGVSHWCYNDGNEELIALSVTDFNSESNQLAPTLKSFYLAGGQARGSQSQQQQQQQHEQERDDYAVNIIREFDSKIMAEAFDVSEDVMRKMQRADDRGFIVRVEQGSMRMIKPDEEEEYEEKSRRGRGNGLEEAFCNMRMNTQLDNRREADIYSRQAGRLNSVNMHKLPILQYLDMSAEKGNLYPNAILAPHWSMNAHKVVYVTRGEGQVQVVGHNGRALFNERVKEGDLFVVPQFYVATKKAGDNGFEWVEFQTSASPMKSPLVGSRSALRGMPLDVLTNSYRISNKEAQDIKYNREQQHILFPPSGRSSS
ncbi:11S globulin seed storage protein 2-like [Tasmannia lanceolata]|uniref:11S globulin seed storage protein 2-like n=1 Tax=Tasmannia lanceolata TaxID=3420 RepID=UPI0040631F5F